MKIYRIYSKLGFYKVGTDYVKRIEKGEEEGTFYIYKEGDSFNKGKIIYVKVSEYEIQYDEI